jgi:hypothetical protein
MQSTSRKESSSSLGESVPSAVLAKKRGRQIKHAEIQVATRNLEATSSMNRTSKDVAMSSQDMQRPLQGEPTAAQQAGGAKADRKAADKDC